jgi:NAD(P)-dependent dehydrogenase (short-subunit alcohol dehydrogenase family)
VVKSRRFDLLREGEHMQELNGRVAVVTGGASGIGFGLASRFAAEGMKIVLGDIESGALDEAVAKLNATGAEVIGVRTDVSDAAQVQALAHAAVEEFGAIHVACNNAGVGGGGISWEAPLDTWEWVFGANLWGVIHGVRSFVPIMMQQPEAHVVNTASIAGLVAGPFMGPYNASKHAVVALSETLHHEMAMMAPHVKVSVLCPGWVQTRIAESARNRPKSEANDPASNAGFAQILKPLIDNGLPPEEVAAKVLAAIRAEQFWVLPHDDVDESWVNLVNARAQSLVDRTNPTFRSML